MKPISLATDTFGYLVGSPADASPSIRETSYFKQNSHRFFNKTANRFCNEFAQAAKFIFGNLGYEAGEAASNFINKHLQGVRENLTFETRIILALSNGELSLFNLGVTQRENLLVESLIKTLEPTARSFERIIQENKASTESLEEELRHYPGELILEISPSNIGELRMRNLSFKDLRKSLTENAEKISFHSKDPSDMTKNWLYDELTGSGLDPLDLYESKPVACFSVSVKTKANDLAAARAVLLASPADEYKSSSNHVIITTLPNTNHLKNQYEFYSPIINQIKGEANRVFSDFELIINRQSEKNFFVDKLKQDHLRRMEATQLLEAQNLIKNEPHGSPQDLLIKSTDSASLRREPGISIF